jgi:hypothetical protein
MRAAHVKKLLRTEAFAFRLALHYFHRVPEALTRGPHRCAVAPSHVRLISKAAGLRQTLTMLRLSLHNAVAIGNAQNDHELVRA